MKDSIQDQLIRARRHQILEAAATVFAEKGFHQTTIKDIAKEAGVADGTIYNYFENKTALLLGIFDMMKAVTLQNNPLLNMGDINVRTFLKAFLEQPLSVLKTNNFALFRIIVSEIMVNPEVQHLYYQNVLEPTLALAKPFVEKWIVEGAIKPVDPDLLLRSVSSMVLGLLVQNIMGDPTLQANWDALPDFIVELLVQGIETDSP